MPVKLTVRNLADLDQAQMRQAVEIFVAAFYDTLGFISTDVDVLVDALSHGFVARRFYGGLLDGNVVGIVGCSVMNHRPFQFNRQALRTKLGFIKGTLVHARLHREFERSFDLQNHQCRFECVATDSAYRGNGISRKIQQHLLETLPYEEYWLEVENTNYSAIRLYEKLGFSIHERKPQRIGRRGSSFNERILMCKPMPKSLMAK